MSLNHLLVRILTEAKFFKFILRNKISINKAPTKCFLVEFPSFMILGKYLSHSLNWCMFSGLQM